MRKIIKSNKLWFVSAFLFLSFLGATLQFCGDGEIRLADEQESSNDKGGFTGGDGAGEIEVSRPFPPPEGNKPEQITPSSEDLFIDEVFEVRSDSLHVLALAEKCPALSEGALIGEAPGADLDENGCAGLSWTQNGYPVSSPWGAYAQFVELENSSPAIVLSGKSGSEKASLLRLSVNLRDWPILNGEDSAGKCSDCSSSFTFAGVLRRDFSSANSKNFLVLDKDGAAHAVGPALGFRSDTEFMFGTQGMNGGNQMRIAVPESVGFEESSEYFIARFDRENGLSLWFQGCVYHESEKNIGAHNDEGKMPAMGFKQAPSGSKLKVQEFLAMDRALSDEEACQLAQFLNDEYMLGLENPCAQSVSECP